MGLKFRKRITVFPWFRLNFSKSWISSTLWVKGLNVNFNKTWNYLNLWQPWSGIYDRIKIWWNAESNKWDTADEINSDNIWFLENEIKSLDVWKMSDEIWEQIKSDIRDSYKQKRQLKKDMLIVRFKVLFLWVLYYLCFWFLLKQYKDYFNESKNLLKELLNVYNNISINLDFNFDSESEILFNDLKDSFNSLLKVNKIWDITSTKQNDWISDRSWASSLLTRSLTWINGSELDFIKTDEKAFKFINKNGGDIFIYPWYVIINKWVNLDIFDIRKLNINYYRNRFIEEEKVCKDSIVLDYTWKYVNKTWTPDKRFSNNFQIPIVEYWNILFESDTWMCEEFCFSSSDLLMNFWEKLDNYISYINGWFSDSINIHNTIIKNTEDNINNDYNIDDYNILKCETWEILDTQRDNDYFNKLEKEKEVIYDNYWKLSIEFEVIKQFWDTNKMVDFETKVHNYFSDEILPKMLDLWLIESIEPFKEKKSYDERYFNTYEYMWKLIPKKKFEDFKSILNNRLEYYKQGANEYLYDLYAKSLRRVWNYYKQNKLWKEWLNIFTIIDDMWFAWVMDKKSMIKIRKELSK